MCFFLKIEWCNSNSLDVRVASDKLKIFCLQLTMDIYCEIVKENTNICIVNIIKQFDLCIQIKQFDMSIQTKTLFIIIKNTNNNSNKI